MKLFALVVTALCVFIGGGCALDTDGIKSFGSGSGGADAGGAGGTTVQGSGGSVGSGGAVTSSTGGMGSGGAVTSTGGVVGSGGSNTNGTGSGGHGDMGGTTGGWKVTFTCSRTPDGLTAIQTWQIINAGGPVAAKSDFMLRAWFTNDGAMPTQPLCDSFAGSGSGCGAVHAIIFSGSIKRPAADSVLQVSFAGDVTELSDHPGAMFGALETSYHNVDWTPPNLLNDYSCTDDGQHLTAFEPWSLVGLYYKGQLVWGTEP